MKITKLETFLVKPRWLFLKIHTDEGLVGLGEPITEGRALTCAPAVRSWHPTWSARTRRRVVHHWQAMYRHAFYRGGPILTSALSGVEQALWDLTGKSLGVPVYQLFGGPTRDRIRLYKHAGNDPQAIKEWIAKGFTAFKTGIPGGAPGAHHREQRLRRPGRGALRRPARSRRARRRYRHRLPRRDQPADRQAADQGAGTLPAHVHRGAGAVPERGCAGRYRPRHAPADRHRRAHLHQVGLPRDPRKSAPRSILQPDLCHAGGIHEVHLIAGMAEAYYAAIAPHNPLGPISLAACIQLDATIPNFIAQEHVSLGEGYLKQPFVVKDGYVDLPTAPRPGHRAG